MIPRKIHRIWLTNEVIYDPDKEDPLPRQFEEWGDEWRERNPGWKVIDWTSWDQVEGRVGPLPGLVWQADSYYPNDYKRFEADVLRLQILHREGGVYVDTDVEPGRVDLEHFRNFHPDADVVVGRSPQHIRGNHPITNCVIAAKKASFFIIACQEQQYEDIDRYSHRSLAQSIGPWSMTRAYEGKQWDNVEVYPPGILFDGFWFTHHWNTARRKKGQGLG